jgi:cyclopropane-fatty-acyl-phospholipid synthase
VAANLRARRSEALEMVGPERERAWQLYMLGSAQAFEAAEITVYQVLSTRSGAPHNIPLTRSGGGNRVSAREFVA